MGWETVRVGHFNLWRENKAPFEDLEKVLPHCDVLTLNEAANHYKAIERACGDAFGFVHAEENGHNKRQNVILYRKEMFHLSVVPTALEKMCEESNGTPERYMLSKRLVHKKLKRPFKVRSTHMNSHVENKSWWHLPRFKLYIQHSRRLRRSLKAHRGSPTVQLLGMDCNVNYRRAFVRGVPVFPYALLRTVGAKCSYAALGMPREGTHHSRLIDGIWKMKADFVRFESQRVITGLGSDHNALIVTIQVR